MVAAARRVDPDFFRQVSQFSREMADWARKVDRVGGERALISTGRKARTALVREMAQVKEVRQKLIRKRIAPYLVRKPAQSYVRVWVGLKRPIKQSELSARALDQLLQQPGAFLLKREFSRRTERRATRAGRLRELREGSSVILRRDGGRLRNVGLELMPEVEPALDKHARAAFEQVLPAEMARQAKLLAKRGFQRSRNRR